MSGKSTLSDLIRSSKNALIIRYILMASQLVLILLTFIVTLLATSEVALMVPQIVSSIILFVYFPIALFLSIRPSSVALDAARIEVAYLGIQAAFGMITMGIGITLLAGPSCHAAFSVDYLPKTLAVCKTFIGVTILNVASCSITCAWLVWLLHLVNSNVFAGRKPWRMSVARMIRARSDDSAARVTLNEHGQIVDQGGMWQLVDPSGGIGSGLNGDQWPDVHPQTPLLAQDRWDERMDARTDSGRDSDELTVVGRLQAPPPYEKLGRDAEKNEGAEFKSPAGL
ncbi:hypothetical protein BD324DRAFT_618286 [Kockovaella imperatae]|uniref:Uncharacterized protein n=1 Tax=Kockovaella imperatae TaxID=4999 RepID=A0A1Y1ULW5_9TREE|nr:hypothetical protein BD324DRAFT_618286 [Kockovaella imperatae]ORX39033.1 hypothetical protein BD324DRAFT_618286 [Kockovaella imperatae]